MRNIKKIVVIVSFLSIITNCTEKETIVKATNVNSFSAIEENYFCRTIFAYEVYFRDGTSEEVKIELRREFVGGENESWQLLTENSELWCANSLLIHKRCPSCVKIKDLYSDGDLAGRFTVRHIKSKAIEFMEITKWKHKK